MRKREKRNEIGIALQRLVRDSSEVRFGIKKVITEHDAAKAFDCFGELLIVGIFQFFALDCGPDHGAERRALLLKLRKFCGKALERLSGFIRLAESNVEGHDPGAVVPELVEKLREIKSRERPVSQHFLGMLVDVHDHDAGVRLDPSAELEARVEAIELQARDKIEERHGPFADKSREIDARGRQRDHKANGERTSMAPPAPDDGNDFFADAVWHSRREVHRFVEDKTKVRARLTNGCL